MTRLDLFDYPLPESAIAQRMIRRPVPPIYSGRGRVPFPPGGMNPPGTTLSPCGNHPGLNLSLQAGRCY